MVHTVRTVNVVFSHDPLHQDCPSDWGYCQPELLSFFLANTLGPTRQTISEFITHSKSEESRALAKSIPKNSENSGTIYCKIASSNTSG